MTTSTRRPKIKASKHLTLRDRLSRLSYARACQLLGPEGAKLIRQGSNYEIDIERDVYLRGDLFRVKFPHAPGGKDTVATITTMAAAGNRLKFNCTACETKCEHIGAAVSLVLEEKTALGLAAPPDENRPLELLSESELIEHALGERQERAKSEKFRITSSDDSKPWTDYTVASALSGKTYRVALRGEERGQSYCSCPDFSTNTLGTCKHVLHLLDRVRRRFPAAVRRKPYRNREAFVHVLYGEEVTLHLRLPDKADAELVRPGRPAGRSADRGRAEAGRVHRPDGTAGPQRDRLPRRRGTDFRSGSSSSGWRSGWPRSAATPRSTPCGPSCSRSNCCPTSLKASPSPRARAGRSWPTTWVWARRSRAWALRRSSPARPASARCWWFAPPRSSRNGGTRSSGSAIAACNSSWGAPPSNARAYDNDAFFTVCNYEQVLRDILAVERTRWDLIILDEGQRIKNWESKTARVIKGLKSPFALVLTGTPLENRLDELYSVVQFVDDRRLPPAFRFFHRHRVVDEKGKVLGYKNLDQLRERLRGILLRRTRDSVLQQLPPRTTELVRIPATEEQNALHAAHMRIVQMITRKAFISEMDLLRLQKALLMCRMTANSTFLVDKKKPHYSSKLEYLEELLDGLFAEANRKVLMFSEWTTMLNLIEPLLEARKLDYVRLDGQVPQKERQTLVNRFREDPKCRVFITTNAGSTGLNLQAANTVINVDLPWNPAVLEQRIARAHRMGQQQPVQVYVLVTEGTIEEGLLNTLSAKRDLAMAALDLDSDVTQVDLTTGVDELRRRLEVLLGAHPEAPVDMSQKEEVVAETQQLAERRERVAAAGGEMLGAVFSFLGELVAKDSAPAPAEGLVTQVRDRLGQCVEEDASGRPRLTVTLPDRSALDSLAQTLARLLLAGGDGNAPRPGG